MKRLLWVALLALLLTGCAAAQSPVPGYLVKLTPSLPVSPASCTGIALDATHVLTANHCAHYDRIVTQGGRKVWVARVQRWPVDDVALLTTAVPLALPVYARLAAPTAGMAEIWATCPWFFDGTFRLALLTRTNTVEMVDNAPRLYDEWSTEYTGAAVCGGDSGGAITANGYVVGLISAVDSDWWFAPLGVKFYAVNGARVAQMVGQE
jgi:hypothetical protein